MRKAAAVLLIVFVFIAASFCIFFLAKNLNQRRLKLADYYLSQSLKASSLNEKTLFLIESDALAPDGSKKVEVSKLFLRMNQPEKAEYYLHLSPNQQGYVLLSEYYIIHNPQKSEEYIKKVTSSVQKDELNQILSVQLGNSKVVSLPTNPSTDLGVLFNDINKGDFTDLSQSSFLTPISSVIPPVQNPNSQALALAKYFLTNGLPNFALFTLNSLTTRAGETFIADEALAQSYAAKNDLSDATTYIEKAITLAPDKTDYYEEGIPWAKGAGKSSKATFWAERLEELKSLQK